MSRNPRSGSPLLRFMARKDPPDAVRPPRPKRKRGGDFLFTLGTGDGERRAGSRLSWCIGTTFLAAIGYSLLVWAGMISLIGSVFD